MSLRSGGQGDICLWDRHADGIAGRSRLLQFAHCRPCSSDQHEGGRGCRNSCGGGPEDSHRDCVEAEGDSSRTHFASRRSRAGGVSEDPGAGDRAMRMADFMRKAGRQEQPQRRDGSRPGVTSRMRSTVKAIGIRLYSVRSETACSRISTNGERWVIADAKRLRSGLAAPRSRRRDLSHPMT
jgi:hypothetical protein